MTTSTSVLQHKGPELCNQETRGQHRVIRFHTHNRDNLSGLQREDSLVDAVATAPLLLCTQDI